MNFEIRDNVEPDFSKKRIVCIGCSCTWGHGIEQNETWPHYLEKLLGRDYQCLNMSKCGDGLGEIIPRYKRYDDFIEPKICIVQPPSFVRQPFPGIQEESEKTFSYFGCSLTISPYENMEKIVSKIDYLEACPLMIDLEMERLKLFYEYLLSKNVKLILILYKYIDPCSMGELKFFYNKYFKDLEKFCNKNKISHIPQFNFYKNKDKKYLLDQTHPNKYGCEVFANKIYKKMLEERVISIKFNQKKKRKL